MLIGVCGGESTRDLPTWRHYLTFSLAICAGKSSVQDFLIKEHGFIPLEVAQPNSNTVPQRRGHGHVFPSIQELESFATQSWQTNYCTTSISSASVAETLCYRPWFLLIHIDAPLSLRWARYHHKQQTTNNGGRPNSLTLENFVSQNDNHLYNSTTSLASLASHAHLQLLNTASNTAALHSSLRGLNLPDPARLRPTWDHYFMTLASLASKRSNCMRRRVGCVLIRNNRVISTGYNGTPRNVLNCNSGGCPRCNSPAASKGGAALATCLCLHAEENALLEAGRERIGAGDAVLYCDTCPCLTCSIKIVQVGIGEVVFSRSYYMDEASAKIFREAGVRLRQFSPVREGLVVLGELGSGAEGR